MEGAVEILLVGGLQQLQGSNLESFQLGMNILV